MDLFFNELSIKNKDSIDNNSVIAIVKVYKKLLEYDVTTCRISSDDNMKLFQMISSLPNSINIRNFYFSFFRSPYESESVEQSQDEYLEHSWIYDDKECIGFALAFLLDSASFSIYSSEWNNPFVEFLKDRESCNVRNISVQEHVVMHIPRIQDKAEIELLKCNMSISDKKIVLRNDHGMDVFRRIFKASDSLPIFDWSSEFVTV